MDVGVVRLEYLVYSETALADLLEIKKCQLDDLRREKGFPFIRLSAKHRVYLADEVITWLRERKNKPM